MIRIHFPGSIALVALALAGSGVSSEAQAQAQMDMLQRCSPRRITSSSESGIHPTGEPVTYFRNGFSLECPAQQRKLRADSAIWYATSRTLDLFSNVQYDERATRITARHMKYFRADDHVEADGNVNARLETGSTVVSDVIKYYPKDPPRRPRERMEATPRPDFNFVERDSATGRTDSTRIIANRILMDGDEVFGSRSVLIMRADMTATADSLYANRQADERKLKLMGQPTLGGRGANPFQMKGNTLEIEAGKDRQIRRVRALGKGDVTGTDFRIISDTVDMFLENKVISRAQARGDSGARMTRQTNLISGNQLDIVMPGGKLSDLTASGRAKADLTPDSTKVRSSEPDRVRGDTIILAFQQLPRRAPTRDTTPPRPGDSLRARADSARARADSAARADSVLSLKSMLAIGNASLFHQRPAASQGGTACVIVDYWQGQRIRATLKDGAIDSMKVAGPVQGFNSECVAGGRSTPGGRSTAPGRAGRAGAADTAGGRGRAGGAAGRGGVDTTGAGKIRIPPP